MTDILASVVVVLAGLYLVGLASVSFLAPAQATRFLRGFAGSALAHYVELIIRFAVGGALIIRAPHMLFSGVFVVFGWVLVITTICLFAVPWQWHHRFARKVVLIAVRHLWLVGIASLVLGMFILAAFIRGGT